MPTHLTAFAAGLAGGLLLGRAWGSEQVRFARMSGLSIAGPDAAAWVTDFLNAAYYRREPEDREVDDLRLAFAVVATRWQREGGRRLRATDVVAFHRAFGRDRFLDGGRSPRGTLDRGQLLEGANQMLGGWFADAHADDERRGWGIAFPSAQERARYRPEQRLELARLGPLTPGAAPGREQTWHTYTPVELPSARSPARRPGRTTGARAGASPRCADRRCSARPSRSTSPPAPPPVVPCFCVGT